MLLCSPQRAKQRAKQAGDLRGRADREVPGGFRRRWSHTHLPLARCVVVQAPGQLLGLILKPCPSGWIGLAQRTGVLDELLESTDRDAGGEGDPGPAPGAVVCALRREQRG